MQQAVGRIPFHICLLPSAYRLLFKCHRWDSNPHCPDSETGASCQLGYRGNLYEHIFLPTAFYQPPTVFHRKLQESNLPSRSRGSPVFGTGPRANGVRASSRQRARQESNLLESGLRPDRRPSASCSNRQIDGCGRIRTSDGLKETPDLQSGAIAALPHTRDRRMKAEG